MTNLDDAIQRQADQDRGLCDFFGHYYTQAELRANARREAFHSALGWAWLLIIPVVILALCGAL